MKNFIILCLASLIATGSSWAASTNCGGTSPTRPVGVQPLLKVPLHPNRGFQLDSHTGTWQFPWQGQTYLATPQFNGTGSGPQDISLVEDSQIEEGYAVHYNIGTQLSTDLKGKVENNLYTASVAGHTYISEFSLKLDENSTAASTSRPDGGAPWYILMQWWERASVESPPISLNIADGTVNQIFWRTISGVDKAHSHAQTHGQTILTLNQWYHFRVIWKASPDQSGKLTVYMSDRGCPGSVTENDLLFTFTGPISYTFANYNRKPPFQIWQKVGPYQGDNLDPKAHHGFSVANLAVYQID